MKRVLFFSLLALASNVWANCTQIETCYVSLGQCRVMPASYNRGDGQVSQEALAPVIWKAISECRPYRDRPYTTTKRWSDSLKTYASAPADELRYPDNESDVRAEVWKDIEAKALRKCEDMKLRFETTQLKCE